MVDILGFIAAIVICNIFGTIISFQIMLHWERKRRLKTLKTMQMYAQDILEEFEERRIKVRVEFDSKCFYLYNAETDEFIAQSTTYKDAVEDLRKRFPNNFFDVKTDDLKRLKEFKVD